MVGLVEQINRVGVGTIAMCVAIAVSFIVSIVSMKDKIMELFDLRTGESLRMEDIENRIHELEERSLVLEKQITESYEDMYNKQKTYHEQSLHIRSEIKDNQQHLDEKFQQFIEKFDTFVDDQNEKTVAGFRSSLWKMHKDFMEQGFVTPDGLKTFIELGNTYEKAGGNDIYHEKLKPEVEALEIHYPDGSVYNKRY